MPNLRHSAGGRCDICNGKPPRTGECPRRFKALQIPEQPWDRSIIITASRCCYDDANDAFARRICNVAKSSPLGLAYADGEAGVKATSSP